MKGISLKGGMPFGFGGVYEKNSLYAILLGAAGPVFRLRLRVGEPKCRTPGVWTPPPTTLYEK